MVTSTKYRAYTFNMCTLFPALPRFDKKRCCQISWSGPGCRNVSCLLCLEARKRPRNYDKYNRKWQWCGEEKRKVSFWTYGRWCRILSDLPATSSLQSQLKPSKAYRRYLQHAQRTNSYNHAQSDAACRNTTSVIMTAYLRGVLVTLETLISANTQRYQHGGRSVLAEFNSSLPNRTAAPVLPTER
jgi:hypothetical protein